MYDTDKINNEVRDIMQHCFGIDIQKPWNSLTEEERYRVVINYFTIYHLVKSRICDKKEDL